VGIVRRLFRWIWGLCRSIWTVLVPGAGAVSTPEHLLDTQRIFFVVQPIVLFGLVAMMFVCGRTWARGFVVSVSCLSTGFLAGFLFGVPKVFQGEGTEPPDPTSNVPYRQRVNTNLEQISDWLTKIIVGLGLFELKQIPKWIGVLGATLSQAVVRSGDEAAVFGAAIVFFVISGFLMGYLVTRLYLQGAMGRADQAVGPDLGATRKQKIGESVPNPGIPEEAVRGGANG